MVKNTVLQTLDSASGSAPNEPDGHPPGLGLRSDAAPRISRRVPHDSQVERRSGLHRSCARAGNYKGLVAKTIDPRLSSGASCSWEGCVAKHCCFFWSSSLRSTMQIMDHQPS